MQCLQNHLQIILPFHQIRAHQKSFPLMNDLLENFLILLMIVDLIFASFLFLFKLVPLFIFLHELLIQLRHSCLISSFYLLEVIFLRIDIFSCIFFLILWFASCRLYIDDCILDLSLLVLCLNFDVLYLGVEWLTFFFLLIEASINIKKLDFFLFAVFLSLFYKSLYALNDFVGIC